jgi:Peptidase M50B-like
MQRVHQLVLVVSTLALCWFGMMAVHETGHVLAAWLSGGTVARVVLHPLTISRTDLADNPQPLLVVWGGPLFGVAAPLIVWSIGQLARLPIWYLLRFFAGFCAIANGAYLGIGSFEGVGDAGDLLRHGASAWHLWLFGALCVPAGFLMWHGLGTRFGMGDANGRVSIATAYGCTIMAITLVTLMAIFGGE